MIGTRKTPLQLMEDCQNLVRSLAWKIHRNMPEQVDVEDLIGYGQIGLAEAAQNFDPDRGSQFTTFAYYRIRGAIYDGLSKMSGFSRAYYQRVRYEQMAGDVLRMDVEESSEPSSTHTLEEDSSWFMGLSSALAVVFLSTHRGDDQEQMAVADDTLPSPPNAAIGRESNQRLNALIDSLPDESGKLIRAVYFEGLTLQEAGQRLGVSKAWASRLHAKTLQRLAGSLRLLGLAE